MNETNAWVLVNKLVAAGVEVHATPEGRLGAANVRLVRGNIEAGASSLVSACSALYAASQAAIGAGWLKQEEIE